MGNAAKYGVDDGVTKLTTPDAAGTKALKFHVTAAPPAPGSTEPVAAYRLSVVPTGKGDIVFTITGCAKDATLWPDKIRPDKINFVNVLFINPVVWFSIMSSHQVYPLYKTMQTSSSPQLHFSSIFYPLLRSVKQGSMQPNSYFNICILIIVLLSCVLSCTMCSPPGILLTGTIRVELFFLPGNRITLPRISVMRRS